LAQAYCIVGVETFLIEHLSIEFYSVVDDAAAATTTNGGMVILLF